MTMQGRAIPRDPGIADFLQALETAVMADAAPGSDTQRTAALIFDRCRDAAGRTGAVTPAWLPVCDFLPAALALDRTPERQGVARAFGALAARLRWQPRTSSAGADARFLEGHANATLLGPGGIEERDDLRIGVSLMAPGVSYPHHDHPPEEVYLALTPGEWWNARMDWNDPGPHGLIYNPPGIRHAMRSGATPFLAVWLLPG